MSWALWDWATQPFNSVILTFVFVSLYLVSDSFLPADVAAQNADGSLVCSRTADAATEYCQGLSDLAEWYGWVTFGAGILILLLAPVLGQRADAVGNKKRWVVGGTAVLAAAAVRALLRLRRAGVLLAGRAARRVRLGRVRDRGRQLQRHARAGVDARGRSAG